MKSLKYMLILGLLSFFEGSYANVIKGVVRDANTNNPISFANILIVGTDIGTTSDFDGNFSFTEAPSGYVKLQASFVGYTTEISRDILVSNVKTAFIEIRLSPSQQQLSELTVKIDPFRKRAESPVSLQSIGIKEIETNPGANRDISRVIQSFPGVGSTPAFRNDVLVRGGGPSENRFFLDGVEIPVLNHFSTQGASGGPVGILNADFISSVNYYASAFPASRYNALSGVFEFTQLDGNPDKLKFRGSLGASEVSATVDGPVGEKSSFIFSARRSYLQFLFDAIGLPFLPTFNDYQFKWKTRINKKNEISIISLGSLDQLTLNTSIEDPDASQEYILSQIPVNNQWSYTFGVVWKRFVNNGYHTLVLSRNMLDNQFYKYPDNNESLPRSFDYTSQEAENKARYEVTQQLNNWKISYGANAEIANYSTNTYQLNYVNNVRADINYNSELNLFKYGFFGQVSRTIPKINTSVSFGIRADGNNFNDEMNNALNQISPRLSASYKFSAQTSLNVSSGYFYQLPAYTTLGYRDNNATLMNKDASYINVRHLVAGIEHKFGNGYLLSFEAFAKKYGNYPINLNTGSSLANSGAEYNGVSGAVPISSIGEGSANGFEILHRINQSSFSLIASYTYVNSNFTNLEGKSISSSWDSKHLLTLTGSKSLRNNWTVGAKWRLVGGLPYTPYDFNASSNKNNWDAIGGPTYNYDALNSERFEPFHQLDLRIDKRYYFNKWNLMVYLDVQNAYNFQNKEQDYLVRAKGDDGKYLTTNNGENYILERIPSTGGTVLPTIGLMIEF